MNFWDNYFVSKKEKKFQRRRSFYQLRRGHYCVYLCDGHTVDFDVADLAIDRAQSWTAT